MTGSIECLARSAIFSKKEKSSNSSLTRPSRGSHSNPDAKNINKNKPTTHPGIAYPVNTKTDEMLSNELLCFIAF